MLFYVAYVREVVCKATKECGCCMTYVGISCYVIFLIDTLEMDMGIYTLH